MGRKANSQRCQHDAARSRDFLKLAHELKIRPATIAFELKEANRALLAVKQESARGAAVISSLKQRASNLHEGLSQEIVCGFLNSPGKALKEFRKC